MQIRYAEDYKAGDVFELGTYEVKQEEIIKFSQKYDPFPFVFRMLSRRLQPIQYAKQDP